MLNCTLARKRHTRDCEHSLSPFMNTNCGVADPMYHQRLGVELNLLIN